LSRFLTTTKKRSTDRPEDAQPDDDPPPAMPVHGADIYNIEFSPRVPGPSSYWKVKSKNKPARELGKLFLAQQLRLDDDGPPKPALRESKELQDRNAVWRLAFSLDGRYLAAAGQNGVIKIWTILQTPDEREAQDIEDDDRPDDEVQLRAPVFRSTPVRRFADHQGAILDMQWSKVPRSLFLQSKADTPEQLPAQHIARQDGAALSPVAGRVSMYLQARIDGARARLPPARRPFFSCRREGCQAAAVERAGQARRVLGQRRRCYHGGRIFSRWQDGHGGDCCWQHILLRDGPAAARRGQLRRAWQEALPRISH
jgi:hypothetical protein